VPSIEKYIPNLADEIKLPEVPANPHNTSTEEVNLSAKTPPSKQNFLAEEEDFFDPEERHRAPF
jgi:hypothetical protein